MSRIVATTLVLLGVITAEQPLAQPLVTLDAMTFNIRTSSGNDGPNAWPHRRELVADVIRGHAPDVIGLQEVLDDQIEYLEDALPGYRWIGMDRGLNGGRGLSEATPIFYRRDVLTPVASGNYWLSDTPDRPPPLRDWRGRPRRMGRIVTWARFFHHGTQADLYVVNTHLTLRPGARQLASVRLIDDRLAAVPPEAPLLVLGDFNAPAETSETWRTLVSGRLDDAWLRTEQRRGPAFTRGEFGPPHDWGLGRIDWILVGGRVDVHSVETVVDHADGRYPSDHYPVVARVRIGASAEVSPAPPSRTTGPR